MQTCLLEVHEIAFTILNCKVRGYFIPNFVPSQTPKKVKPPLPSRPLTSQINSIRLPNQATSFSPLFLTRIVCDQNQSVHPPLSLLPPPYLHSSLSPSSIHIYFGLKGGLRGHTCLILFKIHKIFSNGILQIFRCNASTIDNLIRRSACRQL